MSEPRPLPVVYNPTAGGGRARSSRGLLDRAAAVAGQELEWWATNGPGHATGLAARAAAENYAMVLALGGDGTYNEVARGLLGTGTAMGVLPGGTTSVLAYELGIPRPVDRAFDVLLEGADRDMRVGRTDHGDIFLLMLSVGPDSLVLQRLKPIFKRLGGRMGVAFQALLEVFTPGAMPQITVEAEHGSHMAGWVIVGNAACYAGPMQATPGADPFAPELEVVVHTAVGRGKAVSFIVDMVRGRHTRRADVKTLRTRSICLKHGREYGELRFQIDGDIAGQLPVQVSIHPDVLKIRMPGSLPEAGSA